MKILLASTAILWLLALWQLVGVIRGPGILGRFKHLIGLTLYSGLGILLGAVVILLHVFQAFAGEALVARVTTHRLGPQEFELTYTPADPSAASFGPIQLRGDQWAVSGGIVKWHPWLTALGLKSYHRPMRLSGQFSRLDQQRAHAPTVFSIEPSADRTWEALYWADPYLPFVETVYGSSAYVYVEPDVVQELYVSATGYLIKRAK